MISKKVDRVDLTRLLQEHSQGIVMDNPAPSSTRTQSPSQTRRSRSPVTTTSRARHSSPSTSSIFQSHSSNQRKSTKGSSSSNLTLKSTYRREEEREEEDSLEEGGDREGDGEGGRRRNQTTQTKILNHCKSLQKEYQLLSDKVEQSQQEMKRFKEEISQEIIYLKKRPLELTTVPTSGGGHGHISPSSSMYTDWRIALGELSLNLRREMSEKCGREEMRSAIGIELNLVEKKINVSFSHS
jgi:hypothetical protein